MNVTAKHPRRQFLHLAAAAATLLVPLRFASAQTYPSRPVHWIVAYPAGGGTDIFVHRIGVLVVLDADERLLGILSERDIVRGLGETGETALQAPVAQVMTRNVSTCDVSDSISSVIDRMTKGKFRHMPVLDKDRLAGLVSIGYVLKWHLDTIREHIHQIEASLVEFELIRL